LKMTARGGLVPRRSIAPFPAAEFPEDHRDHAVDRAVCPANRNSAKITMYEQKKTAKLPLAHAHHGPPPVHAAMPMNTHSVTTRAPPIRSDNQPPSGPGHRPDQRTEEAKAGQIGADERVIGEEKPGKGPA